MNYRRFSTTRRYAVDDQAAQVPSRYLLFSPVIHRQTPDARHAIVQQVACGHAGRITHFDDHSRLPAHDIVALYRRFLERITLLPAFRRY